MFLLILVNLILGNRIELNQNRHFGSWFYKCTRKILANFGEFEL